MLLLFRKETTRSLTSLFFVTQSFEWRSSVPPTELPRRIGEGILEVHLCKMYLNSFCSRGGQWLPVFAFASTIIAPYAFRFCLASDYRLSARFSVHVVRRPVVSIRNSVVRGSRGSFYFVSAVIFDKGQIASRALALSLAGRLPRADHLKRGWKIASEGKEKTRSGRGSHSNGSPTPTCVRLCGHCTPPSRLFFIACIFHPLPLLFSSFLLRLLSKCWNCILPEPSINIPFDYSVARRPRGR